MSEPRVKIGDRVSYEIGAQTRIVRVVEDLGDIGVDGRQLVVVAVDGDDDNGIEAREFVMPAEKLNVIKPSAS